MPSDTTRNSVRDTKTLPTPGGLNPHNALSSGPLRSASPDPSEMSGSYFPQYSPRSSANRSPAPSNRESVAASLHLNTDDAFLRSPRSFSDRSVASSSYLTPPEFGDDTDAPPYKSRRKDSESLSMLQERTATLSSDNRSQKRSKGGLEPEGITPIYSREQSWNSKASSNYESHCCLTPRRTQMTELELTKSLYSCPAPPVETRRWSSVEIGAKPFINPPKTAKCLANSRMSSISQESSPDEEFIETVRAKLTSRRVPITPMETPATITLRKASGASSINSPFQVSPMPSPRSLAQSRDSNNVWRSMDQRKPSAYLITRAEIDSITDLIDNNLKRSRSYQQVHCHTPTAKGHFQPQVPVHRPSVCNGFISIERGAPADVATTLSDAHMDAALPEEEDSEQQSTPRRRSSQISVSKILSASSVHEVVWERFSSPPKVHNVTRTRSTRSTNGFEYERTHSIYDPSNADSFSPGRSWMTRIVAGGPTNEHLSPLASPMVERSFEWSESKPRGADIDTPRMSSCYPETQTINFIPVVITEDCQSERSEKSETSGVQKTSPSTTISKGKSLHKKKERTENPFITAVTGQLDVISFPALPSRQKTSDWISPLPDMSAPLTPETPEVRPAGNSKKVSYQLELEDMESSSIEPIVDENQESTSPQVISNSQTLETRNPDGLNDHDNELPDTKGKAKTVTIQHPTANVSRNRSWKREMGGSIGISSGRRKSSGNALKTFLESTNNEGPEAGWIASALGISEPELDAKRKSLSHHAREQTVQIISDSLREETDRACTEHSWKKPRKDTGYVLDGILQTGKGKEKDKRTATDQLMRTNMESPMVSSTTSNSRGRILHHFPYSAPALTLSSYASSLFPHSRSSIRKPTKSSYITKNEGSSDRLNLINQKSLASLQEDCVGIYITMTGANADGDEGKDLCSVECESHSCDGGRRVGSLD